MGFNKVFKLLQEVFPQIDARVLRAVAIENSKDADAAVETVLAEIIPFFNERSRSNTPLDRSISVGESSNSSEACTSALSTRDVGGTSANAVHSTECQNGNIVDGRNQQSVHGTDRHNEPIYDTHVEHPEVECNTAEIPLSKENPENITNRGVDVSSSGEAVEPNGPDGLNTLQTEVSADKHPENSVKFSSNEEGDIEHNRGVDVSSSGEAVEPNDLDGLNTLQTEVSADKHPENSVKFSSNEEGDIEHDENMHLVNGSVGYGHLQTDIGSDANKERTRLSSFSDSNHFVAGTTSAIVHDLTRSPAESSVQSVLLPDMHISDLKESDEDLSNNTGSMAKTDLNTVDPEHSSTLNTSITQSSQMHIIDVLEEIITDARNNKKTLFSSMQSVISLMREVELKEQDAEQAKVEASMGGADILVKVEELKEMLKHAKEANNMYAGEVYGEKAILATELRELQSRVLCLSDEKEKSLGVLDEMRQTLEERLAAAENEINSAELEKVEKEKAAMEVLSKQELMLEKVVQESQMLKQQAEDNAKLQGFLVDRGRIVDMLQGEIAVICQDVRLLKEKFDDNIPLSKSLSSSQTSCILASSSSSLRSSTPEQVESVPDKAYLSETQEPTNFDQQPSAKETTTTTREDRRALLDDGWEFFDSSEI